MELWRVLVSVKDIGGEAEKASLKWAFHGLNGSKISPKYLGK